MVGKVFKYVLALSVLFALLTLPLGAVTTGATITDAAGNPYSYGTYRFEFVAGPGPVAVGTGESTTTRTGVLNASGAFSGVVLGDTSRLGGGCRWKATICSTTGACYSLFINVTAADTSLSTVLSAAAPLLSGTAAGLTFGAATGAGTDMYTLTDSASNTGTGNVLKLATASGSAAKGLTVGCGAQASAASPANGTVCATLTGGAGGASSAALTAGGIGGTITATTGAGGANTAGAGGGTGGAGGVLTLASGVGGAASIGAATGGAGGAIAMTAGTGGGTITGGAGGAVAIAGGAGGNGSTAGGSGGALTVGSGAAGTGGTGTAGAVSLKQGASTILGVATTGAITMASPGAALSPEFLYTAKAQAASPANTQFSVIDTTGNTSTGPLFNVNTVGTSTALPVRFTAGGTANGVSMSSAGILSPIGTGKIAARWSDLGAPGANSTIAHSTYTTGFTWGDTTTNVPLTMTFGAVTAVSTANQFAILDTTASATTGALVNINTVGTSTALPLRVTAKGTANGIQVGIDGIVAKLGTGGVNTTSLQGQVAVANGGTGLASGTSGGVLAYTAAGTLASSAALAANQLVLGGGAGVVPATLGSLGTTTTLLHGNAAGAPTFAAVDVTADITGVTPVANGGTGLAAGTSGGVLGYTAAGTLASSGALTANAVVLGGGAGATPKVAAGFTTDGTSILSLGVAGASTGAISVSGATSGTVTIQPQSAAGTFNFNLPTSAGTAGQPLLSGGGVAAPHTYGTLGVAAGGTGLTAGTSGGIPYYSAADAITSSAALTAGQFVLGGGAGAAPATTFSVVPVANGGTGIAAGTSGGILGYTGAGVIASSGALTAGQFVLGGGAGVLPSTTFSVVPVANGGTNLAAGTSGGVLAYTAAGVLASSAALTQHALVIGGGAGAVPATPVGLGTATTLLHGAAAGDPTWAAVDMAADITGITPVANGGTGLAAGTSGGILGYTAAGVLASSAALTANGVVLGGGAGAVPTVTAAGAANTVLNVGAGGGAPAFNSVTVADGVYVVGPEACSLSLTTGAYAAGPAVAGALTAPYFRRTAIGNRVLELTTTAAANVTYLVCDITPPSRLTAGKGVTLDEVSYLFGFQTTQPTSIGTAAVNSITYAAPASAGGTVAAAGGVLTVTGPNHAGAAVVTGDGQCYNEELSFGTPIVLNTDYRRITVENDINQAAAAATIVQVCGAIVHYTETIL